MPVKAIKKQTIESLAVRKVKAIKVESLYNGNWKKSGDTLIGLCPFHEDSTPSFAIYLRTNSWNCFSGCGGGSVIDFYMKLHNISTKTAIERLKNESY